MNLRAILPLTVPWQKILCDGNILFLTHRGKTSTITLREVAKISSKEYTSLWFHRFDIELTMNTGEIFWLFNISPKSFVFLRRSIQEINPDAIIEEPRIFSFSPTFLGFRIGFRTFKDSATKKFSFENNPWLTLLALIIFAAMLVYIAYLTGNI